MTSPAIQASALYRFYHSGPEETLALRGVTLDVAFGEIVVLAGPSGSGKSTLMSIISGTDDPDGGVVRIDGSPMSRQRESERAALRRDRIGILNQTSELFDHLTIRENVALAQSLRSSSRNSGTRIPIDQVLAMADIGSRQGACPRELSGGETVRAGLAVALANSPTILLADEPTGELDTASERAMLALFRRLAASGMAVVLASHSPAVIAAADRVIYLADGVVVGDGS